MVNHKDTLLAQYANSPTIVGLIDFCNEWIDPTKDLDQFYSKVWDVSTATGYGLDVWGRIVDIPRTLIIPGDDTFFGFNEAFTGAGSVVTPFNVAPFYTGSDTLFDFPLEEDAYRKLILAKAMSNISDCSIPTMNKILTYLFNDRGRVYVKNFTNQTMQIVVGFTLTAIEIGILVFSNVFPVPSGVSLSIVYEDGSSPV